MPNPESNSSWFCLTFHHKDNHSNIKRIRVEDLSLEQAITFLTLHSYGGIEVPTSLVEPDLKSQLVFAPQARYGYHLLRKLEETGLISSSPKRDAFSLHGTKLIFEYPSFYEWNLSNECRALLNEEIVECLKRDAWPENWIKQLHEVIFSLALAECQQFLEDCTNQRFLQISDFDKQSITELLANLLKKYSVSQCQVLILESVKNTSDSLARRICNHYQIAECIIETCNHIVSEAKKSNIELTLLNAEYRLMRSMISHIIYAAVLPGKDWFTMPLSQLAR